MRKLASGALLALLMLLSGCESKEGDGKMRVGVLDTSRILAEMPKYKDLQSNVAKEQMEFQNSLPKPGEDVSEEQMKAIEKDAEKRREEFQKRVNQTIQDAIKDIRDLTNQVAAEKQLDLVIVKTPYSNSVHFFQGQDITLDVMLKMQRQ